jgi:hypothetical protein
MAKETKNKTTAPTKKQVKFKKPNIKFEKPSLEKIRSSKYFRPVGIFLLVLLSIVMVDFFVQYLNNGYSIAVVNGSRISRSEYVNKLDTLYGEAVARQLIDEEIIRQEAVKANAVATEEEVQERLDEIIASIGGQEAYEAALVANNLTEKELKRQISLDIMTKKILEPTIEYSEEDVKAFFEQYSAIIFPSESAALEDGEKLDYEKYRDEVKDIFIQQEVEKNKYTWINSLYNEYRIQDNSASRPSYGILSTTFNIIRNISNEEQLEIQE